MEPIFICSKHLLFAKGLHQLLAEQVPPLSAITIVEEIQLIGALQKYSAPPLIIHQLEMREEDYTHFEILQKHISPQMKLLVVADDIVTAAKMIQRDGRFTCFLDVRANEQAFTRMIKLMMSPNT
jgi:hypothetical protein